MIEVVTKQFLVSEEFLDAPIAELEEHGLHVRTIANLENHFGIHIRGLVNVTDKILLTKEGIGKNLARQIKESLRSLHAAYH